MAITDSLILPADVLLIRVAELSAAMRNKLPAEERDYVLTKPGARVPSTVLDAPGATLLAEFRAPATVAEAVLRFGAKEGIDPARALNDAFPLLKRLVDAEILVPAGAARAPEGGAIRSGERLLGSEVMALVVELEDTEVFQVRREDGAFAALKIATASKATAMVGRLDNEREAYEKLGEGPWPQLLGSGEWAGRPYLLLSWCAGVAVSAVADERRRTGDGAALLGLCVSVAAAYARVHARGVLHGDVHPGNVLVDGRGEIRIIDFGFAKRAPDAGVDGSPSSAGPAVRGGVPFYFEPEYARAFLASGPLPAPTPKGEQYAVAALLYRLLTGSHTHDFSLDPRRLCEQIAQVPPLSLVEQRADPWPEVEAVLTRALAKDPDSRFASIEELGEALARAGEPPALLPVGRAAIAPNGLASRVDRFLRRVAPGGDIHDTGVTQAPLASLYVGSTGIAYALYRIAYVRDDTSLLPLAQTWLARALRYGESDRGYAHEEEGVPDVGRCSPYHTATGTHAVQALVRLADGDELGAARSASRYAELARADGEGLDLAFGLAGVLIGATLLLESRADALLRVVGDEVARRLVSRLESAGHVGDSVEVADVGMAHGWGGILFAALRWCEEAGGEVPLVVRDRVDELAAMAEPFGRGVRFRRSSSDAGRGHYMPGWCGGSGGLVHLWAAAHRVFGDARYLDLAERCGWFAYEHPDVHADLCCGLAGRAYGLLAVHRLTGERDWIDRAREFAIRAAANVEGCLRVDSLFRGQFGVAVLAADLEAPEFAAMPFFESERWR